MSIPGFAAEASIYRPGLKVLAPVYRDAWSGDHNPAPAVQPALSIYVDGVYFCEGYLDWFGNVRCFGLGRRFLL